MHNRESRALQYAMRDRLMALGWFEIEAIDDDLGRLASARFRFPVETTPESEFSVYTAGNRPRRSAPGPFVGQRVDGV